MSKQNLCPLCEDGHLTEHLELVEVEYRGHKAMRPSLYSTCNACGSEQADARQTRINKRDTIAFRKEIDGLLTGSQVRLLRERLGITQIQAAQIFGGGPVAFSKYESDDVTQSEAMDKLLRLAAEVPAAFKHLAHQAGLDLPDAEPQWLDTDVELPKVSLVTRPPLRLVHSQSLGKPDQRRYA